MIYPSGRVGGGEVNLKLLVEFPTLMLCTQNLTGFYDNLIVEVGEFESSMSYLEIPGWKINFYVKQSKLKNINYKFRGRFV